VPNLKVSHIDEIRWNNGLLLWYNEHRSKGIMAKLIRVRLSDDAHWQLKILAAKEKTTMQKIVSTLIKGWLKEKGIEVK